MAKPLTQIGTDVREMTETEHQAYKALSNEIAAAQENEQTKLNNEIAAKQSARAKLKTLGLTDEEIAALVG